MEDDASRVTASAGAASPSHVRNAYVVLAVFVTIVVAVAAYADGWRIDNRVESWAASTGEERAFVLLNERFGGDAHVLVRVAAEERVLPGAAEDFVDGLGATLATLPAVRSVFDPAHVPLSGAGSFSERLSRLRQSPLEHALDAVGEHDEPFRMDLILALEPGAAPEALAALADGLAEQRARSKASGIELRAAGHPLVSAGLDVESRRVDTVFAPLLVVIALGVTALLLRSVPLAVAALLPAMLTSAAVRAALRALGIDANMILVAAAPLVLVVTVASTLHLVLRVREERRRSGVPEAARLALCTTFGPALWAAATTAVGFGVFAVSEVRPVRQLGLAVAVAVTVAVPLVYRALPKVYAALSRPLARTSSVRSGARWRGLAVAAARHRWFILPVTATVLLGGVLAPRFMPVSTDALDYFPQGHPVREEFLELERGGATLSTVELLYRGTSDGSLDGEIATRIGERAAAIPGVRGVFGPADVRASIRATLGFDPTLAAAPILEAAQRSAARIDAAGEYGRITVRLKKSGLDHVLEVARGLEQLGASMVDGGSVSEVAVASTLIRLGALHDALVQTLAASLGLTALVVCIAFGVTLRDQRARMAALLANALPVALALSAAYTLGFGLDAATVMVASVVMGIAVDTTFHLLSGAAGKRESVFGERRVFLRSVERVGPAAFLGAVVLAAGFGALALADFQPTARFGVLTAIGIGAAFVADMVLVPAVLLAPRGGDARPAAHRKRDA